jgi:hypothetical protein
MAIPKTDEQFNKIINAHNFTEVKSFNECLAKPDEIAKRTFVKIKRDYEEKTVKFGKFEFVIPECLKAQTVTSSEASMRNDKAESGTIINIPDKVDNVKLQTQPSKITEMRISSGSEKKESAQKSTSKKEEENNSEQKSEKKAETCHKSSPIIFPPLTNKSKENEINYITRKPNAPLINPQLSSNPFIKTETQLNLNPFKKPENEINLSANPFTGNNPFGKPSPFINNTNITFNFNVSQNTSIKQESDTEEEGEEEIKQEEKKEEIKESIHSISDKVFKGKVDRMYELIDNKYKNKREGELSIEIPKTCKDKAFLLLRNQNGNILQMYGIIKRTTCKSLDTGEILLSGVVQRVDEKDILKTIRIRFANDARDDFANVINETISL